MVRPVARVLLWSLIAVGALRGLMPVPAAPAPAASADPRPDRRAEAVAVAFLREYLTVGDDQAARTGRLAPFTGTGVDLRGSVSVPAGVAQYADLVVAAGSRTVAGGVEVTVLAHVLQVRSGTYHDGGTLAFVVPLAIHQQGIAIRDRPRPTTVPVASGSSPPRPQPAPAALSQEARSVAHQAVVAFVTEDQATLDRLGGGRAPSTRPLPAGWRATSVGRAEVTGPAGALAAQVPVRGRPPS